MVDRMTGYSSVADTRGYDKATTQAIDDAGGSQTLQQQRWIPQTPAWEATNLFRVPMSNPIVVADMQAEGQMRGSRAPMYATCKDAGSNRLYRVCA